MEAPLNSPNEIEDQRLKEKILKITPGESFAVPFDISNEGEPLGKGVYLIDSVDVDIKGIGKGLIELFRDEAPLHPENKPEDLEYIFPAGSAKASFDVDEQGIHAEPIPNGLPLRFELLIEGVNGDQYGRIEIEHEYENRAIQGVLTVVPESEEEEDEPLELDELGPDEIGTLHTRSWHDDSTGKRALAFYPDWAIDGQEVRFTVYCSETKEPNPFTNYSS